MNNFFTYTIELRDRMTSTLQRVGGSLVVNAKKVHAMRQGVKELDKTKLNGLSGSFASLFKSLSPIVLITGALYKLKTAWSSCQESYKAVSVQESRLATIMRNTMGARKEDIRSIFDFANAQEKLGIVSADVIVAGSQELATYLTKKSSLETIIPVMNDMVAQQYGLNASQEQAVGIATMLGKVMDGQVGALSRYGYKFDEAQEKILKGGTEAQRAAVLFDVVNSAVGGVNANLAKTPEGIYKQQTNELGKLAEKYGAFIILIKNAFTPVMGYLLQLGTTIISFFERHTAEIRTFVAIVSALFIRAFETIGSFFQGIYSIYTSFITGLREGSLVLISITSLFIVLTAAVVGYKLALYALAAAHALIVVWQKALVAYEIIVFAVKNATSLWTAAQWLLNMALTANPVGLIIAGIVALIALIAFLVIKIDGWGETWDNVLTMCKLGFESFKTAVTLIWLKVQDAFLTGFGIIEKGWYKVQSLWNEDAANAGLSRLEAERNARAKEIAETQGKLADLTAQMSDMEVFKLRVNETSFSDIANSLKSKLGISSAGIPGMSGDALSGADSTGSTGGTGGGDASGKTANNISTGGSKTTHITLTIGELGNNMTVNANGVSEGAQKIKEIVQDEITRALLLVQANI